jgi:BirA family biotin operon repressor/biotin-[acetyl-CoA-carboxylase] ligase
MKEPGAFEWTSVWAKVRGLQLDAHESLPSTNTKAKDLKPEALVAGERVGPVSLTLARSQTAGRGRSNNEWVSTEGALLSSWVARVAKPPQMILSPLIGLALYQSLDRTYPGLPLSLKAPNDVYLGEKKVAGILVENVVSGESITSIIGVGMNIFEAAKDVPNSTSLRESVQKEDLFRLWPRFLECWLGELRTALNAGQETELDHTARFALCAALNRNPLLDEPILEIDQVGQLRNSSRQWFWHEL